MVAAHRRPQNPAVTFASPVSVSLRSLRRAAPTTMGGPPAGQASARAATARPPYVASSPRLRFEGDTLAALCPGVPTGTPPPTPQGAPMSNRPMQALVIHPTAAPPPGVRSISTSLTNLQDRRRLP